MVGCICIVLVQKRLSQLARGPVAAIYVAWVLLYFAWGVAVAPDRAAVLPAAVRGLELNLLIIGAIVTAVRDRASLHRLANVIQVMVLGNLAVALVQAAHPEITSLIAKATNASMYALQRPAGLWLNPNEAGIAYLFAILLASWASPSLKWLGRSGAALGIFLTASRGAMFPLVAYGVIMLFIYFRHRLPRLRLRSLALMTGIALILIGVGVGAALALHAPGSRVLAEAVRYPVSRFVNFAEATPEGNDAPRVPLAIYWFKRALSGPFQGSGVFSFQGNGTTTAGAHNVFLTVWGETGVLSLLLYVAVLATGIRRSLSRRLAAFDRLAISAIWSLYLVEAFLWHNQFTSVVGILIIGLLLCLPNAVDRASTSDAVTTPTSDRMRAVTVLRSFLAQSQDRRPSVSRDR